MALHNAVSGVENHDSRGVSPDPQDVPTATAAAYRIYTTGTTNYLFEIDTTNSATSAEDIYLLYASSVGHVIKRGTGDIKGADGSGTDNAGTNLTFAGGIPTGNAAGGNVAVKITDNDGGGTGTTLRSATEFTAWQLNAARRVLEFTTEHDSTPEPARLASNKAQITGATAQAIWSFNFSDEFSADREGAAMALVTGEDGTNHFTSVIFCRFSYVHSTTTLTVDSASSIVDDNSGGTCTIEFAGGGESLDIDVTKSGGGTHNWRSWVVFLG